MKTWQVLERVATPEGPLELRRRGEDQFLITIGGRVLMSSGAHESEEALAREALAQVRAPAPRVLIGGLGMGYTLRAALELLPGRARVEVAELNTQVVAWCRGPLAGLHRHALVDRRVKVHVGDVAALIADHQERWDAIILDLYEGPNTARLGDRDPLYGHDAIAAQARALCPGGILAVWSEEPDPRYLRRLSRAGLQASCLRRGHAGRSHHLFLATRSAAKVRGPRRWSR